MLAVIGLNRDSVNDVPPERPIGSSLSAESYELWVGATNQFQTEGTLLFDIVFSSIDLLGPHADQDLRRIQKWKHDGVKDGRALVRWALSFVDRSTLEGQMALLTEINALELPASETLFGLSEHLYKLWDLWLALSSSDRGAPNAFYSQLLRSLPSTPECPIVHVRRYLVEMLDKNESQLLTDVDGDRGLFDKLIKYGKALGLQDKPSASLNYQQRAPAAGGQTAKVGAPAGGGRTKSENECCFSFACTKETRGNAGCICKASSPLKIDEIKSTGRREYVKLLRQYSAANPGKTLKVAIKLVREAVGSATTKSNLAFMTTVESVVGSDVDNVDELDAWLSDNSGASFFVLGDVGGEGSLQFSIEEIPENTEFSSLQAMASSDSSTRSITDAEVEQLRLRAALDDANARIFALESGPGVSRSLNVLGSAVDVGTDVARAPNPSLDRPSPLSMAMTPREVYDRFMTPARTRAWSSAKARQPHFTPSSGTIFEEGDAADGGAISSKASPTELACRAAAGIEAKTRKMEEKLKKHKASKWLFMRIISRILLSSAGCVGTIVTLVFDYCSGLSLQNLATLVLVGYVSAPTVKPWVKLLLSKLSSMMLQASIAKTKSMLLGLQTSARSVLCALLINLVTAISTKFCVPSAVLSTTIAQDAVQAAPTAAPPPSVEAAPTAAPVPADGNSLTESVEGSGTLMMMNGSTEARLGKSVLLASMEITGSSGMVPALMDNGASNGTSCCKTLNGAVAGTFCASDAGDIGLGSEGAVLKCKGSWVYVLRRVGAIGEETVARRLKYTPMLPFPMVFSEASENVTHHYSINWPAGQARQMVTSSGEHITLHMSKSDLGWLKVEPIVDASVQREVLARAENSEYRPNNFKYNLVSLEVDGLFAKTSMDVTVTRSVGMGKSKPLTGVALLRRRHVIDGHPSLSISVKNLRLEGAFDKKLITLEHVRLFAEHGCSGCETAKMRRRAFKYKVASLEPTPSQLGGCYVFDVLELRVPSANTGTTFIYIAVERVSGYALAGAMRGYSEDNMIAALNEIRARVKPVHGEIQILRMDSHPTHRGKRVRDYLINGQLRIQLSPPYVHEGVTLAENSFLHMVPMANALLHASPDLGENHFAQAFYYVVRAKNYSVTTASSPPTSPAMIYFNTKEYLGSGLLAFGAEAMALVHGEARDTKFDDHAKPCIYVGPPINSDSSAHCAVFVEKRYVDVDLGCISVDETKIIERTRRDHSSTQPYNQVAMAKTVDIGKPTSLFDLSGMDYTLEQLPHVRPIIWVRCMVTPKDYVVLLLWHGDLRAGDMSSFVHELAATKVVPIPIDLKIGGQEHNLERGVVKAAVLGMFGCEQVLGAFMQPECSPFTALRYVQPGPPVLFDLDNVDGIPDANGEYAPEIMVALRTVAFVADIFRASAGTDKAVGIEFPAGQGQNSPFAAKNRERHSTIADTSIMCNVIAELKLVIVYTEQGAAGAATRKPTSLLSTPKFAAGLMRTVGTLRVTQGTPIEKKLTGMDADGKYNSVGSEVYSSSFAMRIAIAFLGAMPRVLDALMDHDVTKALKVATDDIYPIGTKIEVYWYLDKVWYEGVVLDTCIRKGMVHGNSIDRREVKVRYASDDVVLWHALCDYNMREVFGDDCELEEDNAAVLSILHDRRQVSVGEEVDFLTHLLSLEADEHDESHLLARLLLPKPPPPPPPLIVPMFITKYFDKAPSDCTMEALLPKCSSAEECAAKAAYFLLSMARIGSRHEAMRDGTTACNAERRVYELAQQITELVSNGPTLFKRAFEKEVSANMYTATQMHEMRLDKHVNGKCSECRLMFDALDACLVCGQMLCGKCLQQGFHAACIAYPALDYKMAVLNPLIEEIKVKKYYCTECGTQNVTWCTGCMRGACCQPNPACYVCDGEPPPQLIPSTVDDISDEELRRPLDNEDKERQRVSMLNAQARISLNSSTVQQAEAPTTIAQDVSTVQPTTIAQDVSTVQQSKSAPCNNLDEDAFREAMREERRAKPKMHALTAHAGEVFAARQVSIDMEDLSVVESSAIFAVLDDSTVTRVDVDGAHKWHTPANEREYNESPQRALWRTAKELKIDDYAKINMYELVLKSSVDTKVHEIYRTLWAYKIKFKDGGLIFDKLNPRWCVKGGTMDRDLFKSYAEMMRLTSLNVLWGIKSEFYDELSAMLLDLKDAFQSTSTVEPDGSLKEGEREFYTEQPPGFKKYGPNGEELVCRQRCYMQGRIDATAGFDKRLMQILTKSANFTPLLWDPKVLYYNNTKHVGTVASLTEMVAEGNMLVSSGMDSEPQQPPKGIAILGQHVDDMLGLATGVNNYLKNRIFAFIKGEIAISYACKLTGWHMSKILGFDMRLDDDLKTVTVTAPGALETVRKKLFTDDCFKTKPRHIVTEAVYERSPGEVPPVGDPMRNAYLDRQSTTRSALGAGIWMGTAYPQMVSGINAMCMDMANPSDARLGQLRHMFMYLGDNPPGKTFGGPTVTSICCAGDEVAPFTVGQKEGCYHYFSDASINVTGGIGMFAGCCIQQLALRMHLQSPCAHTSEIVAGGTNVHAIVPVNGMLQELGIRRGRPTTTNFDSASTVFVATSDAAPKKSVWLARRSKVITETVEHNEISPKHIGERDMVADSCTKYVKHEVWARHMHYILNLPGDPPDCHDVGWVRVPATKNKPKANGKRLGHKA